MFSAKCPLLTFIEPNITFFEPYYKLWGRVKTFFTPGINFEGPPNATSTHIISFGNWLFRGLRRDQGLKGRTGRGDCSGIRGCIGVSDCQPWLRRPSQERVINFISYSIAVATYILYNRGQCIVVRTLSIRFRALLNFVKSLKLKKGCSKNFGTWIDALFLDKQKCSARFRGCTINLNDPTGKYKGTLLLIEKQFHIPDDF